MITNTTNAHVFRTEIAANCRKISMHARPHLGIEPRLAILRAKDDVNDDFT
jgi:hypothetical protein